MIILVAYPIAMMKVQVEVFPAAPQTGRRGLPRLSRLWLDAGYRSEDKGGDWVEKTLGRSVELVERQRKPAPEGVLMA